MYSFCAGHSVCYHAWITLIMDVPHISLYVLSQSVLSVLGKLTPRKVLTIGKENQIMPSETEDLEEVEDGCLTLMARSEDTSSLKTG